MDVLLGQDGDCAIIRYKVDLDDINFCPSGNVVVKLFQSNSSLNLKAKRWAKMHRNHPWSCRVGSKEDVLKRVWKTPLFIRIGHRYRSGGSWIFDVEHG
jgi:hypothetical protein